MRLLIAYAWRGAATVASGPAVLLILVLLTRLALWSAGLEPVGNDGQPTQALEVTAALGWFVAIVAWVACALWLFHFAAPDRGRR